MARLRSHPRNACAAFLSTSRDSRLNVLLPLGSEQPWWCTTRAEHGSAHVGRLPEYKTSRRKYGRRAAPCSHVFNHPAPAGQTRVSQWTELDYACCCLQVAAVALKTRLPPPSDAMRWFRRRERTARFARRAEPLWTRALLPKKPMSISVGTCIPLSIVNVLSCLAYTIAQTINRCGSLPPSITRRAHDQDPRRRCARPPGPARPDYRADPRRTDRRQARAPRPGTIVLADKAYDADRIRD